MNWGANDMEQGAADPSNETAWKDKYRAIIAVAESKFPNAAIWISYPWRGGYDTEAATLHEWIDDLIAEDPAKLFALDDEAIWFKDSAPDGGDSLMVHYTALGAMLAAQAKFDGLGF